LPLAVGDGSGHAGTVRAPAQECPNVVEELQRAADAVLQCAVKLGNQFLDRRVAGVLKMHRRIFRAADAAVGEYQQLAGLQLEHALVDGPGRRNGVVIEIVEDRLLRDRRADVRVRLQALQGIAEHELALCQRVAQLLDAHRVDGQQRAPLARVADGEREGAVQSWQELLAAAPERLCRGMGIALRRGKLL
jgi:hypothetical protein